MNDIKRYRQIGAYNELECMPDGDLCRWADVKALIKERDDLLAQALAAVWLLPEDTNHAALKDLYREARDVFMGKDKQTIAELQDELNNAREHLRRLQRPAIPGVDAVYGSDRKNPNFRVALLLLGIRTNYVTGGFEIEVQLP